MPSRFAWATPSMLEMPLSTVTMRPGRCSRATSTISGVSP